MDHISYDDFSKLDIRIGTVIDAVVPDWSHWVTKLTVDFGDPPAGGGKRTIFAGIMKFYKPDDLIGKQFPFVINLKPKTIGPDKELSEAMMLMALPAEDEDTPPVLFNLQSKIPAGTKVR